MFSSHISQRAAPRFVKRFPGKRLKMPHPRTQKRKTRSTKSDRSCTVERANPPKVIDDLLGLHREIAPRRGGHAWNDSLLKFGDHSRKMLERLAWCKRAALSNVIEACFEPTRAVEDRQGREIDLVNLGIRAVAAHALLARLAWHLERDSEVDLLTAPWSATKVPRRWDLLDAMVKAYLESRAWENLAMLVARESASRLQGVAFGQSLLERVAAHANLFKTIVGEASEGRMQ